MTVCLGPRARPSEGLPEGPTGLFRVGHATARPAPALAPYVDHYWITRWDRRGHPRRTAAALLDPCVHLHVRDGRAEVAGVVRGLYRVEIEGIGCTIGVKFRPGGFHPFVGPPVARWTDRTVSVEEALGIDGEHATALGRALRDEVDACRGDADAHAAIVAAHFDAFLLALEPGLDVVAEEMACLVALIADRADVRRVGDLVRVSGRSERTLHRLFVRYVGVNPAWVLRFCRLRAAARRLTACPRADVKRIAYELGYADQAHLIRDFRATIGITPGAFVSAQQTV